MLSPKQLALLGLLLFLCSNAFADGMGIKPDSYALIKEIEQESQIAHIDFDGQKSTVSLFVSFDFSDYPENEMIWIVPFKEVPDNVTLEEKTLYQFQQEFADFDKEIKKAESLNKAYKSDFLNVMGFITTFHYLPIGTGAFFLIFVVSSPAGSITDTEKSFEFGDLGRADVYKVSDKATLEQFFQENNAPVPSDIRGFLDKHIVVFRINRTKDKMSTLVTFDFGNRNELFYPSSTTDLWPNTPSNYVVKVRAPINYRLSPNLRPNIEVNDLEHQYFVFSPSCVGLNYGEFYECYQLQGYGRVDYEEFRKQVSENPKLSFLAEMYDTDLEIGVKEERRALPVGMFVASIVNPWVLAVILIFVSWILAVLVYSRLKKKYSGKEIILFGLALPIAWAVINLAFSIGSTIVLIAFLMSSSFIGYFLYTALPLVFLVLLAGAVFVFKITVADHFDRIFFWAKGRITFRDFVAVLLMALGINALLIIATMALFLIHV